MHEAPYAQALLDMALTEAGGRPIKTLVLGMGQFSAIVPESLEMFFTVLSQDTPARDAELVYEIIPVVLTCSGCGGTLGLDVPDGEPVMPFLARQLGKGCQCGSQDLHVTGGLGVDLIRLELEGP